MSEVPGRIPGSKAIYRKEVDGAGTTIGYIKTTLDPSGNIVHVKDKFPGGSAGAGRDQGD